MGVSLRLTVALFGLFLSFYLLTSGGHPYSTDGHIMYLVGENLVQRGSISIANAPDWTQARVGADGQKYAIYAPLQTVAELPFIVALRPLMTVATAGEHTSIELLRPWAATYTNATISAATVALTYVATVQLGYTTAVGVLLALVVGLSSIVWPYSRFDFSEPLQTLLLLGAFIAVRRVCAEAWLRWSTIVGFALAGLFLTKAVFALVVPVFALAILARLRSSGPKVWLGATLALGVPLALGVTAHLGYNYARWGSPLDFGYYLEVYETPVLIGLYGWFLSSGKSVFLYTPILVLAAIAAPRFYRHHRLEALIVAGVTFAILAVYVRHWSWHGDWAWGTRYSVPLHPLWLLALAPIMKLPSRAWRLAIGAFALLGVFVQVLGVSIDFGNYMSVQLTQPGSNGNRPPIHQELTFTPRFSPILGHWWLLTAALEQTESPDKPPAENRALQNPPWAYNGGGPNWRPPNPEYGMHLDYWLVRARPESTRRMALQTLGMSFPGLVGVTAAGLWFLDRRRGPRRSAAPSSRI